MRIKTCHCGAVANGPEAYMLYWTGSVGLRCLIRIPIHLIRLMSPPINATGGEGSAELHHPAVTSSYELATNYTSSKPLISQDPDCKSLRPGSNAHTSKLYKDNTIATRPTFPHLWPDPSAIMGSVGDAEAVPSLPVIDFAKWNSSTSREEQLAVAKELTNACRRVGFVYIINHGLPQEMLDEAFDTAKRLFDLSHKQKMQAPHPDGPEVHRGYSYPGLEKVSQYMDGDEDVGQSLRQVSDVKESFEIGSEGNAEQPNVWLPEETLPGFKEFTSLFYWECNKVAQSILRAMALGIGLDDPDYLIKYHSGHNNQLRLLHYPPVPAADLEGRTKARMPAHTDWGSIVSALDFNCVQNKHTSDTVPDHALSRRLRWARGGGPEHSWQIRAGHARAWRLCDECRRSADEME